MKQRVEEESIPKDISYFLSFVWNFVNSKSSYILNIKYFKTLGNVHEGVTISSTKYIESVQTLKRTKICYKNLKRREELSPKLKMQSIPSLYTSDPIFLPRFIEVALKNSCWDRCSNEPRLLMITIMPEGYFHDSVMRVPKNWNDLFCGSIHPFLPFPFLVKNGGPLSTCQAKRRYNVPRAWGAGGVASIQNRNRAIRIQMRYLSGDTS